MFGPPPPLSHKSVVMCHTYVLAAVALKLAAAEEDRTQRRISRLQRKIRPLEIQKRKIEAELDALNVVILLRREQEI